MLLTKPMHFLQITGKRVRFVFISVITVLYDCLWQECQRLIKPFEILISKALSHKLKRTISRLEKNKKRYCWCEHCSFHTPTLSSKQYWELSQEMSFLSLQTFIISLHPLFHPLTNPPTPNLSCLHCKRMVF